MNTSSVWPEAFSSHKIMATCDCLQLTERSVSWCGEAWPLYPFPIRAVKAAAQEKQNNFRKKKKKGVFYFYLIVLISTPLTTFTPKEIWLYSYRAEVFKNFPWEDGLVLPWDVNLGPNNEFFSLPWPTPPHKQLGTWKYPCGYFCSLLQAWNHKPKQISSHKSISGFSNKRRNHDYKLPPDYEHDTISFCHFYLPF